MILDVTISFCRVLNSGLVRDDLFNIIHELKTAYRVCLSTLLIALSVCPPGYRYCFAEGLFRFSYVLWNCL